jgi:hypothetical protein
VVRRNKMKGNTTSYVLVIALIAAITAPAQVGTGGSYTLEQSVIAGGGGGGTGGNYSLEGTTAQSITGGSTGAGFALQGGFWPQAPLAPSAAGAAISGRVILENGGGLKNAMVYLEGGRLTAPMITQTGNFGYFSFEDVETGQSYVISVNSKRYAIVNNTRAISLIGDLADVDFQAVLRDR